MPPTPTRRPPLAAALSAVLERDLATLRREVEAYPDEHHLWREVPGVPNVGGTLVLHLTGNLQHYIGARLGRTGYVRDRPAEFDRRHVPRSELLRQIDEARSAVTAALEGLSDERLDQDFPEVISGLRFSCRDYLLHLATHFAYHLGQIDYHRRVVTRSNQSVNAMRQDQLVSASSVNSPVR
jgi:uncharacterized damage-inducible protein DinB